MTCDVCGRPLNPRGAKTLTCAECRRAGSVFTRQWCADLQAAGLDTYEIGDVVGLSREAVRSRLSEQRRSERIAALT